MALKCIKMDEEKEEEEDKIVKTGNIPHSTINFQLTGSIFLRRKNQLLKNNSKPKKDCSVHTFLF